MTVEDLLQRMFPGDQKRGYPAFDHALEDIDWLPSSVCEELNGILAQTVSHSEDVNETLKALRRDAPDAADRFVSLAVEAYFSSVAVAAPLRGGMRTLFPNARSLPEIDYDLLEPVMTRMTGDQDE